MSRNLVLVSNLFSGDNRLISMAPSIEGIIIDLLLKRRMIFTAHTTCAQEPEARKDIIYRLGTIYSPTLVEYFKENVFPIYLKKESLASMWD